MKFVDPIPLPRGRQLVTLRDAALYITKLSKAEHDAEQWQAAMQALLLVADARADRHAACNEPARRARVQSEAERPPLGVAEAGAGSLTSRIAIGFASSHRGG
jgi:hypothetical protein